MKLLWHSSNILLTSIHEKENAKFIFQINYLISFWETEVFQKQKSHHNFKLSTRKFDSLIVCSECYFISNQDISCFAFLSKIFYTVRYRTWVSVRCIVALGNGINSASFICQISSSNTSPTSLRFVITTKYGPEIWEIGIIYSTFIQIFILFSSTSKLWVNNNTRGI